MRPDGCPLLLRWLKIIPPFDERALNWNRTYTHTRVLPRPVLSVEVSGCGTRSWPLNFPENWWLKRSLCHAACPACRRCSPIPAIWFNLASSQAIYQVGCNQSHSVAVCQNDRGKQTPQFLLTWFNTLTRFILLWHRCSSRLPDSGNYGVYAFHTLSE